MAGMETDDIGACRATFPRSPTAPHLTFQLPLSASDKGRVFLKRQGTGCLFGDQGRGASGPEGRGAGVCPAWQRAPVSFGGR